MKKLTDNQIELLNSWDKISHIVEKIYEEIIQAEITYGKDSDEYRKIAEKLEIALEAESGLENEFTSEPEIFLLAKEHLPIDENNRIMARQKKNVTLRRSLIELMYRNLNNDILENLHEEIGLHSFLLEGIKKALQDKASEKAKREESLFTTTYIFENIIERNYLYLLESEIEEEQNPKRKEILIKEKYSLLSRNQGLEKHYFRFGIDLDLELMDENEFVAESLGIPLDEYKKLKKEYLASRAEVIIHYLLPKSQKHLRETEKEVIGIELRSILLELGTGDLEYLYDSFEEGKSFCENDNCASYIADAFDKSVIDFNNECKRKRKIPNN